MVRLNAGRKYGAGESIVQSLHRTVCVDRTKRKRVNDIYTNIYRKLGEWREREPLGAYISAQTRREEHGCDLDSTSFPPAMLYHFLHTPLSSFPNRRGAIFSSVCFLQPGFSLSRFYRGRRTSWRRVAVRKSSKRRTRRKQTRRRPANAILSRPTDRFVVSSFRRFVQ